MKSDDVVAFVADSLADSSDSKKDSLGQEDGTLYKGLIDTLANMYGFVCRGRGKVPQARLQEIASGAHTMVEYAPAVLGGESESEEDRKDLKLAEKMDGHIDEAVAFLQSLEIV